MNDINILITSVGRRTKLVDYFKEELINKGKIIATDCSNLAPALYTADKYYIVPRIDNSNYISSIKTICEKENIKAVLSLIDPELSLLSKHKQEFKNIGVDVIVSSYEVCELFLDKYDTFKFCKANNFKCAKTYNDLMDFKRALEKKEISFPVFVKPQKGSASLNINKANNLEETELIFNSSEDMIIQEFLNGKELGIDVYIDIHSKKVSSVFVKEKLVMRSGETDKSRSLKSEKLFDIINQFVKKSGFIGPIDIDVFDENGEYYISEVNPRFGGGYPHAYECGVNFPRYIINNLMNLKNEPKIGDYKENTYMMKHDTLTIKTDI